MAGCYTYVPRRFLAVVGAAAVLSSVGALSACSSSPEAKTSAARVSATSPTKDVAALKAATDKAAAEQDAAVKAAAKKYLANKKIGEIAASRSHPVAKAAAACGVPLASVTILPSGSRIGVPDVPRAGDMWRVKATSPKSPGMIIYWPDGGSVLCR